MRELNETNEEKKGFQQFGLAIKIAASKWNEQIIGFEHMLRRSVLYSWIYCYQVTKNCHVERMLLKDSAISTFDKRLPQNRNQCSATFLTQLTTHNGPVDMLGGSWECQSVSRAGRQRGAMDPRFKYFYDLVRIINFFLWSTF